MPQLSVAVFGVGIAGKARIRDIGSRNGENINWDLVGFVSRRKLEIEGTVQLEEEDVYSRPDIQAVVVCTEPAAHEAVVRQALNHGKHCLVEYPVATTSTATTEIYELAKQKGLILHEENIGLLTPGFLSLKEKLQNVSSPIIRVESKLTGNYNGWAENFEKSGGPFCGSVSLVQTMYELLGNDILATGGHLEVTEQGFTATAKLSCSKCRDITITVRRTKEKTARRKELRLELADGSIIEEYPPTQSPYTPQKPGLFMQDFLLFLEEVNGRRDPSHDIARTIHCIQVAEQIHSFMGLTKTRPEEGVE